ncbi:MAG: serine hydrolase domain-containing protein [Candidatus Cybelea sp.]
MIPAALVGVWEAAAIAAPARTWVPATPLGEPAHYFLVVSKGSDGRIGAFIRNPEFNSGAALGTLFDLPAPASDGTLRLERASVDGAPLVFHRAGGAELRWFYPRPESTWHYRVPEKLPDGWSVGRLSMAGMREAPLGRAIDDIVGMRTPVLRSPYVQSISIARHGRLVLDEYFYGFTPDTPHDTRSAAKSVATLIVGRAIEDTGRFTPQSRVLSLLPSYLPVRNDDPRKAAMRVADLMTMASGLACNDNDDSSPGNEETMQSRPAGTDWYRYTLDLPMAGAPGTTAVYCTAGINLLGAIVAAQTHEQIARYFARRFAVPLQFGRYAMWLMPPPANEAYLGGGDYIRPRDFLKFGELLLDGGTWNGTAIVDSSWIEQSIVPRTEPQGEGDRYGYGWHLTSLPVDGKTYEVVNAGGNGGQLMIVVPKLDLAIMITAGNYNQYPVWRAFLPQFTTAAIRSCTP